MKYQNINTSSNCIVSEPQDAGVTLSSVKSQIMDWDSSLLMDLEEWIKAQLQFRSLLVGMTVVLYYNQRTPATCYVAVL